MKKRLPFPSALAGLAGSALLAALAATAAADQPPVRVSVAATDAPLAETPLIVPLGADLPPGPYALQPDGDGPALPANVFADAGQTCLGFILPQGQAGQARSFTLRADRGTEPASPGVEMSPSGPNIAVSVGGEPFTAYVTDGGPKPFYYPIIGPTGKPMTRGFPIEMIEGETRDHRHHRSMWFTHMEVNGVDFWSEEKGHGTIRETTRRAVVGGPAVGLIRTTDEWLSADGRKVCEDERVVRFYDTQSARIMDFDITLKAIDGPVTIGDTEEGTFGIRLATTMSVSEKKGKKGGRIINAEGLTDKAAWGKASTWVDYTGPVDGETVGLAILNHPSSFRFPTTWHVRPYGLFAANPFGWEDFGRSESGEHEIPTGGSITLRYRLIFHKGDTESADIPAAFRSYAEPPKVEIQVD